MNKSQKILGYSFFATFMIVMVASLSAFFYVRWAPADILETYSPINVNKSVYQPGETLTYTIQYCKNKNIQGSVARFLLREGNISPEEEYPTVTNIDPVGCRDQNYDLQLPKDLPDGEYKLYMIYSFRQSSFREVDRYYIESVHFEIKAGQVVNTSPGQETQLSYPPTLANSKPTIVEKEKVKEEKKTEKVEVQKVEVQKEEKKSQGIVNDEVPLIGRL